MFKIICLSIQIVVNWFLQIMGYSESSDNEDDASHTENNFEISDMSNTENKIKPYIVDNWTSVIDLFHNSWPIARILIENYSSNQKCILHAHYFQCFTFYL